MPGEKKKSLYDEIKEFHKEKKKYVVLLFFFGILGLVFPVIPGLLLLGLGVALLDPVNGEKLLGKAKDWIKSFVKKKL